MVREEGLEPPCLAAPEPKSGVSANFTTRARNAGLQLKRRMDDVPSKKILLERKMPGEGYEGYAYAGIGFCGRLTGLPVGWGGWGMKKPEWREAHPGFMIFIF